MPYKERDIQKRYYTIGEVADMFKVATSLIRFWEKEFETLRPKKNKKGNRQYTQDDVKKIQHIYYLVKEKGFTLSGAKESIKNNKNKPDDAIDALNSLKRVRSFLIELRDQL